MTVYAENLLFNVASGVFPGEYNVKRKPTKLKIVKPVVAKVIRIKSGPTSTQSRYLQNKRKTNSIYDSWTPARRASYEKSKAEKNQTKK